MNDVGTMTRITGPGHGHPVTSDVRLVLEIVFLPKQALRLKTYIWGKMRMPWPPATMIECQIIMDMIDE